MTKRSFLFALLIALLLLCACGKSEAPVTTEPATAPPTTAMPVTKAPEPETVISYDFHLDELPDIGSYQPKTVKYFYDEPLKQFKTSKKYGTLLPYYLGSTSSEMGEIGNCGLMTADGRIVTDSIFGSIYTMAHDGRTVYCADLKVFAGHPESIPDWSEDEEGARAAYDRATEYYEANRKYLLISSDGSKSVTLSTRPSAFMDSVTGLSLICCGAYREMNETGSGNSFLLYDFDLNLVADLSSYVGDYDNVSLFAVGSDSFVLEGVVYQEEQNDYRSFHDLLFFEDGGELDHILEMDEEYPYDIEGGLIRCQLRFYDENGRTVYTFEDEDPRTVYDPIGNCHYVLYSRLGKIVKLNSRGSVLATAETPATSEYSGICTFTAGGSTYVIVPRDGSYSYYNNTDGFVVYDGDLKKVCEIGKGADRTTFCDNFDNRSLGFFLVVKNGKTDILDVTGNKLASVPFAYEDYDFNFNTDDNDLIYLCAESAERCAVYDPTDNTVNVIPSKTQLPRYPVYFNKRMIVYSENILENDNYDWRYVFQDIVTGERLLDNITDCNSFSVNRKTWFNYSKNGTMYVCDEDLNVIASLNDGNAV